MSEPRAGVVTTAVAGDARPSVVHSLPGRLRVHFPRYAAHGVHLAARIRGLPGVTRARANPLTGNVLVEYDPPATDEDRLLDALAELDAGPGGPADVPVLPHAVVEKHPHGRRVHVALRGLDRLPDLARRAVERLERFPGVHARPDPLTGRVILDLASVSPELDELLGAVAELQVAPASADDSEPSHPFEPAPLVQSIIRLATAALGLGVVAARQAATGEPRPRPLVRGAVTAAAVITLVQGFPALRSALRKLIGPEAADIVLGTAGVFVAALAGGPVMLTLAGGKALALLEVTRHRRGAWRRYEAAPGRAVPTHPGALVRPEPGDRVPALARVVEGTGTATDRDGLPAPIGPGARVTAGARLYGGPFALILEGHAPFDFATRPVPASATLYDRYLRGQGFVSLGYAAVTALRTRSFFRTFQALLLVNPVVALVGAEAANRLAVARAVRGGATFVGSRRNRPVRRPDVLLVDGPRVLTHGLELTAVLPLTDEQEPADLQALAAGVSAACGSPWGPLFPPSGARPAGHGRFEGDTATATVDGARHLLTPGGENAARVRHRGEFVLTLTRDPGEPLGLFAFRRRLAAGVAELVRTCRVHGVDCRLLGRGPAGEELARRAGVPFVDERAMVAIRDRQRAGAVVGFLSDSADAAAAFAACDIGIGLSSGRSGPFPARADLLASDLLAVAAIVEAGARRGRMVRDAVGLSVLSNVVGAVRGWDGVAGLEDASRFGNMTGIAALGCAWARLRGGDRPRAALAYLTDPRPERWGRREPDEVLQALRTTADGLSTAETLGRRPRATETGSGPGLWAAVWEQCRSPITSILACGGCLALTLGRPADAGIIAATVGLNIMVGVVQERRAGRVAESLRRMSTTVARVLRDGEAAILPASEVVPGDVLLLVPGDQVAADARLIEARGLQLDEANLTGESAPVEKGVHGGPAEGHVVLEGTGVVAGTGRAVVVAVGRHTRMGATAATLASVEARESPLGAQLGRLLRLSLPVAAASGLVVTAAGFYFRRRLADELAVGVSVALSAVPEGLPLLAGMGQGAVARRLARRGAPVRRLSAVQALGRVDVVCTDKTGTMTEGRLAVTLVADAATEVPLPGPVRGRLRGVLLTAALASPHPDAPDAAAHPTDVAVVRAAVAAGLGDELRVDRGEAATFDSTRAFHAVTASARLRVKGAPEALVPRCAQVRQAGTDRPLTAAGREELLARARQLAAQGLRVLLVAEGPPRAPAADPHGLVAVGFIGISDPLRNGVPDAVRRCRAAGVRVVMITGDHPATARAVADRAGLLDGGDVLTGPDIAELPDDELDRRLARAVAVARATPLDKLRIVESLRRQGHTVGMTGDGVNDAPALRTADVGIAMGRGGTEVARQAADLVLADDAFPTLVEALVEGRGFWGNLRRGLGLLMGGNLGEVGLLAGSAVLGFRPPLNTAQILTVNLITDALPALAVVVQEPEGRDLAGLVREGAAALDARLRREVLRRGTATAVPSLAAYLAARATAGPEQAGAAAYGSVVAAQLAQTLGAGWVRGRVSGPVVGAVATSAGLLGATFAVPWLRTLLGLAAPGAGTLGLIGAASGAAVVMNRLLTAAGEGLSGDRPAEV